MKQITSEIKAKIFALYWGQEIMVWFYTGGEKANNLCKIAPNHMASYYVERGTLEVKPLSSITDEDAIDLCKYWYAYPNQRTAENGRNIILTYGEKHSGMPAWLVDCLRSKGYALPYMDWSVDELVEAGVFKLKEVNND